MRGPPSRRLGAAVMILALGVASASGADADLLVLLDDQVTQPLGMVAAADRAWMVLLEDPRLPIGSRPRACAGWAASTALILTMGDEWRHQRQQWGLAPSARTPASDPWSQPVLVSPTLPYADQPVSGADDPAAAELDAWLGDGLAGPSCLGTAARRISAGGEPFLLANLAIGGAAFLEAASSHGWASSVSLVANGQWQLVRGLSGGGPLVMPWPWDGTGQAGGGSTATAAALRSLAAAAAARQAARAAAAEPLWSTFWRQWNAIYGITVAWPGSWRMLAACAVPALLEDAVTSLTRGAGTPPGAAIQVPGEPAALIVLAGGPSPWAGLLPLGAGNGPAQVRQVQCLLRLGMPGSPPPAACVLSQSATCWSRACADLLIIEQLLALCACDGGSSAGPTAVPLSSVGAGYASGGAISLALAPVVALVHGEIIQEALGRTRSASNDQVAALVADALAQACSLRAALLGCLDHGDPAVISCQEGFDAVCGQVTQAVGAGTQALAAWAMVMSDAGAIDLCTQEELVLALLASAAGLPDAAGVSTLQQELRLLRCGLASVVADPPLLGSRMVQAVTGVDVAEYRQTDLVPPEDPDIDFWTYACTAFLFPKMRRQDHRLFLAALAQEWVRATAASLLAADGLVDAQVDCLRLSWGVHRASRMDRHPGWDGALPRSRP